MRESMSPAVRVIAAVTDAAGSRDRTIMRTQPGGSDCISARNATGFSGSFTSEYFEFFITPTIWYGSSGLDGVDSLTKRAPIAGPECGSRDANVSFTMA